MTFWHNFFCICLPINTWLFFPLLSITTLDMVSTKYLVFLLLGMVTISTTPMLANMPLTTTKPPTEKKTITKQEISKPQPQLIPNNENEPDEKPLQNYQSPHEKLLYRKQPLYQKTPLNKQYSLVKVPQFEKPLHYYRLRQIYDSTESLGPPIYRAKIPIDAVPLNNMVNVDLPN